VNDIIYLNLICNLTHLNLTLVLFLQTLPPIVGRLCFAMGDRPSLCFLSITLSLNLVFVAMFRLLEGA